MHGAMCMSVSGRCLLSQYLAGRDANRGQCAQPCRWKYQLVEEKRPGQYMEIGQTPEGSYILNADDLCMAPFIDLVCQAGVTNWAAARAAWELGAKRVVLARELTLQQIAEIRANSPDLGKGELFRSGINVGRDMMGTMSNTLILAFAGSSINTLIMIYSYSMPYLEYMNGYEIGIELLRGISGSLGVILTVPFVSFISAMLMTGGRRVPVKK